jgi:thiol-disulfide isomerase/thioredoxin
MLRKILSAIIYLALMMALGFAIYHYFLVPNKSTTQARTLSAQTFFAANLPNEKGINQVLSQYKGKIVVLNFWATWCAPCREEMPELSELYTEYKSKNVVVLGVAVDELALVKEFSLATPVSYPLFAAENDGMNLGINLGNDKGVLPYTVIINADGNVVKTFFGRINKSLIVSTLKPLLPP